MTNFIDLNVLNFFVSISNKGFHILDSIMIFFTVLADNKGRQSDLSGLNRRQKL